jgi:hypothetical protein
VFAEDGEAHRRQDDDQHSRGDVEDQLGPGIAAQQAGDQHHGRERERHDWPRRHQQPYHQRRFGDGYPPGAPPDVDLDGGASGNRERRSQDGPDQQITRVRLPAGHRERGDGDRDGENPYGERSEDCTVTEQDGGDAGQSQSHARHLLTAASPVLQR